MTTNQQDLWLSGAARDIDCGDTTSLAVFTLRSALLAALAELETERAEHARARHYLDRQRHFNEETHRAFHEVTQASPQPFWMHGGDAKPADMLRAVAAERDRYRAALERIAEMVGGDERAPNWVLTSIGREAREALGGSAP